MQWYQALLLGACAFAFWQGDGPLRRAALVLLANAAAVTLAFLLTGNNANIEFSMLVDIISAAIIMHEPAGREQGWLGFTYAFQIGAHVAAARMRMSGVEMGVVENSYWQILNYAFLVQIGILVAWGEAEGGKLARVFGRLGGRLLDRRKGGKAGAA